MHDLRLWVSVCGFAVSAACAYADGALPRAPSGSTTLRLEKESDGDLRYCDPRGTCVTDLPNPNGCVLLEAKVDHASATTCERCLDANGRVIKEHCANTSVACVLMAAFDPDCVVCAYIDRAVIHTTCSAEALRCEFFTGDPGGAWVTASQTNYTCKRCYDAGDRLIIDTCAHNCAAEVCSAVQCGDGYQTVTYPGECCPRCVPSTSCAAVVCSAQDAGVPACFDGYRLERDASDCCAHRCVPSACPAVACPATSGTCPSGYAWDGTSQYPDCCGRCVPSSSTRYCTANDTTSCNAGEICTVSQGECLPPPGCDPATQACSIECYGVCRPPNHACAAYAYPFADCAGYWADGGRDEYGCPLPPVCTCYDGTVSGDGTCPNRCEGTACFYEGCDATSCADGYRCESGYPYCCGGCVRTEECLYNGTNKATGEICPAAQCTTGYREQLDANCCPACVLDGATYCTTSTACSPSMVCSTACGDCLTDPACAPGGTCSAVCYGTCVSACGGAPAP